MPVLTVECKCKTTNTSIIDINTVRFMIVYRPKEGSDSILRSQSMYHVRCFLSICDHCPLIIPHQRTQPLNNPIRAPKPTHRHRRPYTWTTDSQAHQGGRWKMIYGYTRNQHSESRRDVVRKEKKIKKEKEKNREKCVSVSGMISV